MIPLHSARCCQHTVATGGEQSIKPGDADEPGFFKKIIYRFKGIPLKGEVRRPRSLFDDIDKEWFAPQSLPEVPRDYKEHPERDLAHYPYPARRMYPPKARLLVIPDSWMTPFYKVTGVSGPYLFIGGLVAFLINKEIFVIDENAVLTLGFIIFYWLVSRTFGYRIDNFLYGKHVKQMDYYKSLIEEDLKGAKDFRMASAAETASLKAAKENFPAVFKENMEMQLEAGYRKNVQDVALELKRRMDYLQEVEATKHRFERDHMLAWITQSVRSEIATNKDKIKDQYLNKCIEQLKSLSASAKA